MVGMPSNNTAADSV